ncbi:MAG TPA: hypothetical protein PL182_04280, partial [Pseudobdellovibrionaceae bacterium]|nr:hypothetical protein [Pseudobdellovibrionaceae bacterium]
MGRTGFVQKKILRSGLMGLLFLFVGCTQKQNTDPIVVPPGQLIEYSNELFLGISSTFYSVELHRLNAASGEFFSIRDITPESKERVQTVHFVLPKDLNQAGVYLVRANMSRQGLNFSALVIPGRLTRPSIESTLTAEIIGTYPGFDYDRLTPATVVEIETYIAKKAKDLISLYGLNTEEMGAKVWMSFLRNNLGVDPDFHALLEPVGIEFTLNSGGKITGPPFPFGAENRSPVLDLGNSTSTTQPVPAQEMSELLIRARATDPEGHFLLFQWSLEGKVAATTEGEFRWIPQFDQSRPEPYQVRLLVTDGGTPSIFQWNVMVSDLNRPPQVTVACPKATKEWETWHCSISAVDYDGDPITFRISDKDTKARVSVNGQQTDDTTRVLGITAEKIEIEYTPNNLDAERRNFFLDISASDGKMGQTFIPQNVLVEDINSPPTLVTLNGSPVIPFLAGDVAREWDYCSNSDPDGGQPFKFYFEIRDPDNQTAAAPRNQHPDEVAVTFGGPLKEALRPLTEAEGCPVSTPEVMYFCYEWRPTSFPRTGNLTLQLKDN